MSQFNEGSCRHIGEAAVVQQVSDNLTQGGFTRLDPRAARFASEGSFHTSRIVGRARFLVDWLEDSDCGRSFSTTPEHVGAARAFLGQARYLAGLETLTDFMKAGFDILVAGKGAKDVNGSRGRLGLRALGGFQAHHDFCTN